MIEKGSLENHQIIDINNRTTHANKKVLKYNKYDIVLYTYIHVVYLTHLDVHKVVA